MLLKALYDVAHSPGRHILDDMAFERRPVRWIVDLDAHGRLHVTAPGPMDTASETEKRGHVFDKVPRTARTKKGKVAEFLADGIAAVFGLSPNPARPNDPDLLRDKCDDFWRQVNEAADETGNTQLKALAAFRPSAGTTPPFLIASGSKWQVRTASGNMEDLRAEQFTFQVDGRLLLDDEGIQNWWRKQFAAQIAVQEREAKKGSCMITGESAVPVARTHTPRLTGIPGVGIDGAIVSFEKSAPAFASYGQEQSHNAPCSISATWAYSLALQYLLDHKDHHLRLGGTVLVFWARQTETGIGAFADLLNAPQPDTVRAFMNQAWAGMPRQALDADQFFAATLAGNAGRVVVRHWMQMPLLDAAGNLKKWFADLHIEAPPLPPRAGRLVKPESTVAKKVVPPLSLYRLACTTVREAKKMRPEVPVVLCRAALEGTTPPIAMLKPILAQLQSRLAHEGGRFLVFDEPRFALLKLILNRNRKEHDMEILPGVADTRDPAYNCGRLLAVFDNLQRRAHGADNPGARLNTTLAERYFASASSAPATAFAVLWRLHQHHLKKLRQKGKEGATKGFGCRIGGICARFDRRRPDGAPELPRVLTLAEQGRFALGFYQEQVASREAARRWFEVHGRKGNDDPDIADVGEDTNETHATT